MAIPFQNQSPAPCDSPPKRRPFHHLLDRVRRQGDSCPLPAAAHAYVPRINCGGNFCGHDPLNPRLELAQPARKGPGGLPRILTLAMENLSSFYDDPRKVLPSLDLANGSSRRMRSERREASVLVGQAFIKRMDLATLRVGAPTPSGFLNYTQAAIAKDTGLSLKRVSRVMTNFKGGGLVVVSEIRERAAGGSWRAVAAVKRVSENLFAALGLETMLKQEREKARRRQEARRLEEERAPASKAAKGRLSLALNGLFSKRATGKRKPKPDLPDNFEARKRLSAKMAELKQAHWDWDHRRILAEARKLLP